MNMPLNVPNTENTVNTQITGITSEFIFGIELKGKP